MSTATPTRLMTSDDLFAMRPNKKVDRWLFRGELRETKVTMRNPSHSATVVNTAYQLKSWLKTVRRPAWESLRRRSLFPTSIESGYELWN